MNDSSNHANRRPTMLALALALAIPCLGQPARADTITPPRQFSESTTFNGTAGGNHRSDCGYRGAGQNDVHVLEVAKDRQFELTIADARDLNLFVDGPDGPFCIPPTGDAIVLPGFWRAGTYRIEVTTQTSGIVRPYQLTISAP